MSLPTRNGRCSSFSVGGRNPAYAAPRSPLRARLRRRRRRHVGHRRRLALHLAGGGHNDAWIAGLVLAALALAQAGRGRFAGIAWALAVIGVILAVIFLIAGRRPPV